MSLLTKRPCYIPRVPRYGRPLTNLAFKISPPKIPPLIRVNVFQGGQARQASLSSATTKQRIGFDCK